jgi:glycopeptide antibiotics resistance protein
MIPGSSLWIAWPLVAAPVVLWQMRRRARWPQLLGALALVTYAWWICSVAFFPLPLGDPAAAGAGDFAGRDWVNLVPFRESFRALSRLGAAQIIREFGGNVLLFVPFTLFGPSLWPRLRTWWWPLAAGLGGSLAIELIQFVLSAVIGYPYRQTDVDDVILNTFGAFAGYALFLAARAVGRRLTRRAPADEPRE